MSLADSTPILRHRTALTRKSLSVPVRHLLVRGLIGPTFLDYGCGKGDDVRRLADLGVPAVGYDPHFAPALALAPAHTVNLGFVLNVIEDADERIAVLRHAFALTDTVLAVSARTTSERANGVPYGDGYRTSRDTFQKYYTQAELRALIEHTLGEPAHATGQGMFIVFKDKVAEHRYLHPVDPRQMNLALEEATV